MAQVLLAFSQAIRVTDGPVYAVRACGREREDGMWEGWLEFTPDDRGPVRRSGRETTQPNFTDLRYWATGLSPVYLEGALERVLSAPPPSRPILAPEQPAFDGPAPAPIAEDPSAHPVLDPFSVFAKGEDLLRQQLHALSPRHLRAIARAYRLAPVEVDVEALAEAELVAIILSGVRARLGV